MTIRLIFLILITNFVFAKDSIETWGYLMKGEESYFPKRSSITDVAYFEMKIDVNGDLKGNLSTPTLPPELRKNTRSHIVITSSHHPDLYHHYLNNELPFRTNIINNIVKISKNFDGVQIDFEGINQRDGTNFLNFLCDLKQLLPKDKILSVAVMARWKNHKKLYPMDAYDYSIIGRIADRVIIMSANPGRIIKDLRVSIPRPRSIKSMLEQEFFTLKNQCFDLIRQQSLLAFDEKF